MAGFGLNLTKPVYKIETYTGDVLDHTITDDAFDIIVKETLTQNVGTFTFTVPTKKNGGYYYDDIALFDKVKIWLDYNSVSGNPIAVGRVYQISGPLSMSQGYVRVIKGRNQSEILQRRFQGMEHYINMYAYAIVDDVAEALGLGTGEIDGDETRETHLIDIDNHERYIDFLKKVSDYWKDAGTQVKHDFYVDVNNNLVWQPRPLRTEGVEAFTVGENIISYNVLRDLSTVTNKIWVYGAKLKAYDNDKDFGTDMATPHTGSTVDQESASEQKNLFVADTAPFSATDKIYIYYSDRVEENVVASVDAGVKLVCENNLANTYPVASGVIVYPGWGPATASTTIIADAGNKIVGSRSVKVTGSDGGGWCGVLYKPLTILNFNYFPSLNFYLRADSSVSGFVRLQDSDGNFLTKVFSAIENDSQFHFVSIPCGRDNEDGWDLDSGYMWTDIYTIEISMYDGTMNYLIDGLFQNHRRFSHVAEDVTSQTNYGIREMVHTDDALTSDGDCERRAEALLYQFKEPPIRIDLEVPGNSNVLIGDRVSLTIPAENISAQNFDVVTVVHKLASETGWRTFPSMINSANVRQLPPRTRDEILVQKFQTQREISRGIRGLS